MLWRQAWGKVLARRGELQAGERLAREAVALGAETDMLNAHADALIDLAEVLALAGQDARPELEQALALYERKGNSPWRIAPGCESRWPRRGARDLNRGSASAGAPSSGDVLDGGYDRRFDRRALDGGDGMNDKPKWHVAHLDEIERRGRDIPVREHLGIHAFGINAYTPGEDGTLIGEHDEAGSGQEELYLVLDGKATFEVDGEAVDAPAGTLVFVRPESRRKATGDGTVLAIGATPGEAYEGIDWGEAWPFHNESMQAYGEQRYADALEAVRSALERMPDHAGLNYNYACFATLAGDTGDDTFAHLRRSVELLPRFREDARKDDDFAAVRDDPRFEEALR